MQPTKLKTMKTYDEFLLDQDPDWHRHPNGGGLIYKNAYVDETAFVSEHAKVLSGRVLGNARIEDSACVYNDAVVKDNARVYGGAWIFDNAIIAGNEALGWLNVQKFLVMQKLAEIIYIMIMKYLIKY